MKVILLTNKSLSRREGKGGGGSNLKNIFIALFHVLDYLDQFKAIKENLLRQVGHLDPLRAPTHLRLSQKPKFVVVFFWSQVDITIAYTLAMFLEKWINVL